MQEKLSAEHIFNHTVPQILSDNPQIARKVNAVLGIELTGENGGYWTLDLTENPAIAQGRTKDPKCTLSCHVDDFEALLADGSVRSALEAFKQKRIQAKGHLPTILKLEGLLRAMTGKSVA
ncbi:MAG TPA: SCP2 sterol-binding domain-containing protein [Candidatus Aquicultor sp.]|jgi:hypothetical protein